MPITRPILVVLRMPTHARCNRFRILNFTMRRIAARHNRHSCARQSQFPSLTSLARRHFSRNPFRNSVSVIFSRKFVKASTKLVTSKLRRFTFRFQPSLTSSFVSRAEETFPTSFTAVGKSFRIKKETLSFFFYF